MRYILQTDQAGPTYLAAFYEGKKRQLMVTKKLSDACSYKEASQAERDRQRLKDLFAIDSVLAFSIFE